MNQEEVWKTGVMCACNQTCRIPKILGPSQLVGEIHWEHSLLNMAMGEEKLKGQERRGDS